MSGQTIQVPIVLPIREAAYRKTLITNHFFKKIKYLIVNDTFSHGGLMSAVDSSFEFETGSVETQSNVAALVIQRAIFNVDNLRVAGFMDAREIVLSTLRSYPRSHVFYVLINC